MSAKYQHLKNYSSEDTSTVNVSHTSQVQIVLMIKIIIPLQKAQW